LFYTRLDCNESWFIQGWIVMSLGLYTGLIAMSLGLYKVGF